MIKVIKDFTGFPDSKNVEKQYVVGDEISTEEAKGLNAFEKGLVKETK